MHSVHTCNEGKLARGSNSPWSQSIKISDESALFALYQEGDIFVFTCTAETLKKLKRIFHDRWIINMTKSGGVESQLYEWAHSNTPCNFTLVASTGAEDNNEFKLQRDA